MDSDCSQTAIDEKLAPCQDLTLEAIIIWKYHNPRLDFARLAGWSSLLKGQAECLVFTAQCVCSFFGSGTLKFQLRCQTY